LDDQDYTPYNGFDNFKKQLYDKQVNICFHLQIKPINQFKSDGNGDEEREAHSVAASRSDLQ
jgi:hypothetical protein